MKIKDGHIRELTIMVQKMERGAVTLHTLNMINSEKVHFSKILKEFNINANLEKSIQKFNDVQKYLR
jgi:predicted transcriptional regulator